MKIADNWIKDLPQQFQGKENIEVLINAFADELQEIADVFAVLCDDLDIDTASGKTLDLIGSIVSLTRAEAYTILNKTRSETITDELYRKCLKWKLLKNTCDGTYADVMKSIELIWGADKVSYTEDPDYPAHIFLAMDEYDIDADDPTAGKGLPIKASGVEISYSISYLVQFLLSTLEAMEVPSLEMAFKFPFWDALFLDGSVYLDGSKYLNYRRNYQIIIGLIYSLAEIECDWTDYNILLGLAIYLGNIQGLNNNVINIDDQATIESSNIWAVPQGTDDPDSLESYNELYADCGNGNYLTIYCDDSDNWTLYWVDAALSSVGVKIYSATESIEMEEDDDTQIVNIDDQLTIASSAVWAESQNLGKNDTLVSTEELASEAVGTGLYITYNED